MKRSHSVRLRVAAVACGLALALALAELGLHLAGPAVAEPRLPLSYKWQLVDTLAAGQAYVTFDPDLGWVTTPGIARMDGKVSYRHNRDGLRADREYAPTPPPGVRRIAAYGDSFTYCEQVDFDECWTRQLEGLLPASEVLNYGVPGYAPDQAWLRYQRDGAATRPCAVLIGHQVENINRMVNRFRPFYYPRTGIVAAKPRFILEGDRLVPLAVPTRRPDDLKDPAWVEANLGPRDAWYFPGLFMANPLDRLQLVSLVRTAAYRADRRESTDWGPGWAERMYRPGSEAFDVLRGVLVEFAERVRADGATPVVLIFPTESEIAARHDGGPKPHAPLLAALEQRGVPTIDLTDTLGAEASQPPLVDPVGHHYRPPANALVARALANQLPRLTGDTCDRS